MSFFRFNLPFSMRTTDFFFGTSNDIGPQAPGSVNVFTTGLPQITNNFSITTAGESSVNIGGTFFTNAAGTRDGTIRSMLFGDFAEDDDDNNIILITGALSNLNADRSQFDDLLLRGNPLAIFGLLGSGGDNIGGSNGNDELFGFSGDDTMLGGGGNDTLKGGGGDDILKGAVGADNVNGGSGDDVVRGNGGFDTVIGGAGEDRLFGGGGQDVVRGGAGDDTMNGNAGADRIFGGAGDDVIDGANGSDLIDAGAGDDVIRGGNGADTLEGGEGDDRLTGGSRADTFVFASNGGDDIVADYEDNLDKLHINGNFSFVDIDIDQDGANTVISFGAATITLLNQDATELTETDFLF